jgi:hypothetical protein
MKTPPFLLGAALLFWGWQTDFLIPGAIMAVILEGSRFIKMRWDLSDDEFKRIWTFCALLFLAAAVYAFADSGLGSAGHFFGGGGGSEQDGPPSARTASALIRWTPMLFFLFVAAQVFSMRQEVPLHVISLILQWRWKQAKKLGKPPPATRGVDVTYPYFAACLFAASVHHNENHAYFWGLCVLLAWALWAWRPRTFGISVWASALLVAMALGYAGASGIGILQRYVDGLNMDWMAFLARGRIDASKSQTQLGQIGRIKTSPRIVIRLRTESGNAPQYLREASYRVYRSPAWLAGRSRNDFVPVRVAPTNENTWLLLAEKTNAARVGIVCYLDGWNRKSGNPEGLLPLPSGSTRLENLPAYALSENSLGAVLEEGRGLAQFDVLYGPGATIDSPPETNAIALTNFDAAAPEATSGADARTNRDRGWRGNGGEFWRANRGPPDLQVPTNEAPALDKVITELHLKGQDAGQAMATLNRFFATQFTYSTWQDAPPPRDNNETALSRFLLETRSGHCEYFATATVLLLREAGIPARYAVGYFVHESGWKGYVVRQRDAHAWCLVWNQAKTEWENFDTTPGSWLQTESQRERGWIWLSDAWSWVEFQFARVRWGQTHLRDYVLIGLVPVLALLLFQILRQRRKRRGSKAAAGRALVWPGMDSDFYRIEKLLAERGVPRGPNEPLADWLERAAAEPQLEELRTPLRALLQLHYRYRFDPEGLSDEDRESFRRQAGECLERLSRVEAPPAR